MGERYCCGAKTEITLKINLASSDQVWTKEGTDEANIHELRASKNRLIVKDFLNLVLPFSDEISLPNPYASKVLTGFLNMPSYLLGGLLGFLQL